MTRMLALMKTYFSLLYVGGDSHMKETGTLVVSVRSVNCRLTSYSGVQKAIA